MAKHWKSIKGNHELARGCASWPFRPFPFVESAFLSDKSRMSIAANCCCCLLLKIIMNCISQCHDIRANFSLRPQSSFCKRMGNWTIINTTNTLVFFKLVVLLLGMPYRLLKHFNQVFRDRKGSDVCGATKKLLKIRTLSTCSPALLRAATYVLYNKKPSALGAWNIQKFMFSHLATSNIYIVVLWESSTKGKMYRACMQVQKLKACSLSKYSAYLCSFFWLCTVINGGLWQCGFPCDTRAVNCFPSLKIFWVFIVNIRCIE